MAARCHRADAPDDLRVGAVFEQVAAHVELEGGFEHRLVVVNREKDDGDRDPFFAKRADHGKAIQARQPDVEDGHFRPEGSNPLERRLAIGNFSDDLERVGLLKRAPEAVTEERMILGNDDTNLFRHEPPLRAETSRSGSCRLERSIEFDPPAEDPRPLPDACQPCAVHPQGCGIRRVTAESPAVVLHSDLD